MTSADQNENLVIKNHNKRNIGVCSIIVFVFIISLVVVTSQPQSKSDMLGSSIPQPCPSNQVFDSNYYGVNRGGDCRHIYYISMIYKPVGLKDNVISILTGKIIQIEKNTNDGYIITLESGQNYNLNKISNNVKLNSLINIDVREHSISDCVPDAITLENGTEYHGKQAYDYAFGEHNIFYFNAFTKQDFSKCDQAKYVSYSESLS